MIIKVRRQRELLSRLEDEMGLIRERREEVRRTSRILEEFRFNLINLNVDLFLPDVCHSGGKEAG